MDWGSIGVCWALSTVTTLLFFAIYFFVLFRHKKHRKRKLNAEGRIVKGSTEQLNCLLPVTTTGPNRPITNGINRRTRDEVSEWCKEHGLPEILVGILRNKGFCSRAGLDGLRPEDLQGNAPELELPTFALRVQLREVLTKLHGGPSQPMSSRQSERSISNGPSRITPQFTRISEDSGMHSPSVSDVFTPEIKNMDKSSLRRNSNLIVKERQSDSRRSKDIKNFHGMLSDDGLWKLTNMLGCEWRHLAALLKIEAKTQEILIESSPHNIHNAIHKMLLTWRNKSTGSKEQIKGQLLEALREINRIDIANALMREQLHGSDEEFSKKKLTSVI